MPFWASSPSCRSLPREGTPTDLNSKLRTQGQMVTRHVRTMVIQAFAKQTPPVTLNGDMTQTESSPQARGFLSRKSSAVISHGDPGGTDGQSGRIQDSDGLSASGEIMSSTSLDQPGFHHDPPHGGVLQGPPSLIPPGILALFRMTRLLPYQEVPSLASHCTGHCAQHWITPT